MSRTRKPLAVRILLDIILPMVIIVYMTPQDLKTWRKEHGYTQQRLADALGTYQVTVARWENGTRAIPNLLALALKGLECETKTRKEE